MNCPEDCEFVCALDWSDSLYQEALSWVDEEKRVAILSSVEKVSEDPRIKIYTVESPLQIPLILRKIAWSAVFKKLHVIGDPVLKGELERCHLGAHLILSEAADYWVLALKNARGNQKPYRRGLELKGAFQGIPAIIVGAGPSLEKNRHLLKEFEKRALIFAGGSALNVIDVEPHFAASIDADAPYRQFKRHPFSETPFCYQSRMNRDNFSLIHGEKLLFPDSSSEAINWIHGEEMFDGGWTVGNFLTKIAVHFGCSPVIFVGMDLCYEKGRKYAELETALPDGLIEARGAITQKDWLMSAEWTEELAQGKEFLNATEGGLLQLPSTTLSECLKRYPILGDLRFKVHELIQKLPLREATQKWEEWDASLTQCKQEIKSGEIAYQKLLSPLWEIWKPIFEREIGQKIELHQKLFFQTVLEEHG